MTTTFAATATGVSTPVRCPVKKGHKAAAYYKRQL